MSEVWTSLILMMRLNADNSVSVILLARPQKKNKLVTKTKGNNMLLPCSRKNDEDCVCSMKNVIRFVLMHSITATKIIKIKTFNVSKRPY